MSSNDDLFSSNSQIRWYHYVIHIGYYIPYWIRFIFSKPFKETKKDLDILETVNTLLDSETTDENINKCKELTHLHRVIENTKARRRLEKWSLRVIALYLFVVLSIVVLCYSKIPFVSRFIQISIPPNIMITILSTTTVNIIGLGLIVLRGHFLANNKSSDGRNNNE